VVLLMLLLLVLLLVLLLFEFPPSREAPLTCPAPAEAF
jgi:hypothetical protein